MSRMFSFVSVAAAVVVVVFVVVCLLFLLRIQGTSFPCVCVSFLRNFTDWIAGEL